MLSRICNVESSNGELLKILLFPFTVFSNFSGFMIFGVLTSAANQYFTVFTFILIGLSILGVYFLLKLAVAIVKGGRTDGEPANIKLRIKSIFFGNDNQATIFILFGIARVFKNQSELSPKYLVQSKSDGYHKGKGGRKLSN